jgi:hypothetical protein
MNAITWKQKTQRPLEPKQLAKLVLCQSPSISRFSDDEEYYFFRSFCSQTAPQLTTCTQWAESQLWSKIVLQASEAEPCIRHAIMQSVL